MRLFGPGVPLGADQLVEAGDHQVAGFVAAAVAAVVAVAVDLLLAVAVAAADVADVAEEVGEGAAAVFEEEEEEAAGVVVAAVVRTPQVVGEESDLGWGCLGRWTCVLSRIQRSLGVLA